MSYATPAKLVCTIATAATLAAAGCGTTGHNSNSSAGTAGVTAAAGGSNLSVGKRIQQALMTGVSYMIPFVAAGGLLIALGFLRGRTW